MRKILWTVVAVAAVCVATACSSGGKSSPGNSATGTWGGNTIAVKSAASANVNLGGSTIAVVLLSDQPDVCTTLTAGALPKSSSVVLMEMGTVTNTNGGSSAPSGPGSYSLAPGASVGSNVGVLGYVMLDNSCNTAAQVLVTNGTIDVTGVSGDVFKGKATGTTPQSEAVTATFNPTGCPGMTAALVGTPTCQ